MTEVYVATKKRLLRTLGSWGQGAVQGSQADAPRWALKTLQQEAVSQIKEERSKHLITPQVSSPARGFYYQLFSDSPHAFYLQPDVSQALDPAA